MTDTTRSKHLPQGLADWLGIAGFVVAVLTFATDSIQKYWDRPTITLDTPNRSSAVPSLPMTFSVAEPLPSGASIAWSFTGAGVRASVNGEQAAIKVTVNGRTIDVARPLRISAVATNRGTHPLRFVSATVTYGTIMGTLKQRTKAVDVIVEEGRRRAVIEVATDDAAFLSIPLAIGVLDELGECHSKFIEGPGKYAFAQLLSKRPLQTFCSDPILSQVVSIP